MANKPGLIDQWGRALRRAELKREVAAATIGGVRSPISGYPGDGLTPERLASILRSADQGNPTAYLELAEIVEERDPHYLGVIGTRRRSVSQIDITVTPGSDSAEHERHAQELRDWLDRDELSAELFDILDCIPKGFSFTEIIWDTSAGDWSIARLEHRDPRWFPFDRRDLRTPMMLDDRGLEVPLPAFKFIQPRIQAKSGLPLRSGLSRVAMWSYLFKAFTGRDWAIFSQTYGQPLRVGKWGPGATEADKDTLFMAVANIAGDCAAIIPESMSIDFVESGNVNATGQLYKERVEHLDMQISKAVLGQTATTDAMTGGLGSGKEHREVQEDIQRSDCKALSAALTRDLAIPFVMLNHGPQAQYPRIRIAQPEPEDLSALTSAIPVLVNAGVRVSEAEVRQKFGLKEPDAGERILGQTLQIDPETGAELTEKPQAGIFKRSSAIFKRSTAPGALSTAQEALQAVEALSEALSGPGPTDAMTDRLAEDAAPLIQPMLEQLEEMLAAAGSLEEAREMWLAAYPDLDASAFAELLADAMSAAQAAGIAEVADG